MALISGHSFVLTLYLIKVATIAQLDVISVGLLYSTLEKDNSENKTSLRHAICVRITADIVRVVVC